MVRRHGWQLPAHTLQVAAITVFFLLAVAYYIFLAPFLWMTSLEDTAYALYTPLALAVFLLYVRCTAINPADPGVLGNPHHYKHYRKESSELSAGITPEPAGVPLSIHNSSPSSVTSSVKEFNMKASSLEEGHQGRNKTSNMCSCGLCGLCCGWMVIPDDSCRSKPPVDEENVLFCTLCNAEVRKFSKHCRSCDKCVDGFDHHCRWLNNCIGTKNYRTFVALMTTSLLLLTLEWGVGIAVFVRCFVDKHGTEAQISQKLGNGFTRAPFATVVAVCTLVAMLASFPLFELFFFHLILIKKGITTYEYVVAVRAQPGELTGDLEQSGMSSTSSSTVVSRSSSVGLRQHGGLCTPPRVFTVEHQDEVDPPSVDPPSASRMTSSTIHPDRPNGLHKKRGNVRISAWRLAKLNAEDAAVAAAKAREASSVLRPLGHPDLRGLSDSDESLSSNGSQPSSMSTDFGLPMGLGRGREDVKATMSLSPYKSELPRIRTGREQGDPVPWSERALAPGTDPNGSSSRISTSVATTLPSSLSGTPFLVELPHASSSRLHSIPGPTTGARPSSSTPLVGPSSMRINIRGGSVLDPAAAAERAKVMGVISDGYDPSSGETTDDVAAPSLKGKLPLGGGMKLSTIDSKSPPVFWNRGTGRSGGGRPSRTIEFGGRGISTSILSAHESRRRNWRDSLSSPSSQSDPDQATPEHAQYSTTPSPSTASHPSPNVPAIARLPPHVQISSPSIFYSGPLMPIGESSGSRPQQLPPRPPGALMKSGMPKHSGVGSSSRSFSTRASAQPFQTPVFVPRNSNRPRS